MTGYDAWMVDGDLARHLVWAVVVSKVMCVDGGRDGTWVVVI